MKSLYILAALAALTTGTGLALLGDVLTPSPSIEQLEAHHARGAALKAELARQ